MTKSRRAFIQCAGMIGAAAAGKLNAAAASAAGHPSSDCTERGKITMQCVVTGRDKSGRSVIVSHAPLQPVTAAMLPGYDFYRIWGSDSKPTLPSDGTPPPQPEYFPPPPGYRFGIFTIPPATSAAGRAAPSPAEIQEMEQKLPGLLGALEPDHPGMHTTETVDFDVVVLGEVVLELDDGAEVTLKAGDCVVQNGTRHAWHNRSSEKCVIAFSLLGAGRKPAA